MGGPCACGPHTNKKWAGQDPGTPTGSPPMEGDISGVKSLFLLPPKKALALVGESGGQGGGGRHFEGKQNFFHTFANLSISTGRGSGSRGGMGSN